MQFIFVDYYLSYFVDYLEIWIDVFSVRIALINDSEDII